ncbi:MAG: J domain-containing protein [Azonexus sp.]|jgi:DnaJ-class molecular chaperone|nr:J domain-containing protein [Azonexus sp.]
MKARNHYSTLSIDRCATCDEIKRAYRTLAKRFHPDVTDDLDGEAKFKDVAEAYRTLKYPEKRVAYDHQIHNICAGERGVRTLNVAVVPDFDFGLQIWSYWSGFWTKFGVHSEM